MHGDSEGVRRFDQDAHAAFLGAWYHLAHEQSRAECAEAVKAPVSGYAQGPREKLIQGGHARAAAARGADVIVNMPALLCAGGARAGTGAAGGGGG